MNWPPAALVAGVFVIGLAVGFVLSFGLWPGGRPTERLPPTVAVVAAHLLIGVGLIWYAAEPARWLRTVLVVLVVPGTFAVLLSVAVIGFKQEASWAAGDDEQGLAKERERGAATLTLFGREFPEPVPPVRLATGGGDLVAGARLRGGSAGQLPAARPRRPDAQLA